jgi:hypothetical protein
MVSTQRPSQAEQVASSAWLWADGGFIFADAPNAVTSAAAIVHQVSMRRNIAPLRAIRQSRASSRTRSGFTTIVQKNSSPARSFTHLTRIRWINRCRGRPKRYPQIGRRCFANRGRSLVPSRDIAAPSNLGNRAEDDPHEARRSVGLARARESC